MGGADQGRTSTIGRYAVYGELASGGMATVHLGRLLGHGGFSRVVAIKRLHPQFARDPDFVEMLLDEARIAASVVHPNVVPTLDVIAEDNEVLLVMEYVRGVSLAQIARALRPTNDRIPLPIVMGLMTGLLRGLHAAHEATDDHGAALGIVHRDVSPQNVLVGVDGMARVVDFGVAKAVGRLQTTRDGRIKGKLAYMAPEQLSQGGVTRRTDVYAAAIVMWELVTGQRLFGGDTGDGLLGRLLNEEAAAPSTVVAGLPPGVDEIVARGLRREASERYATAREMAEAIEARLDVADAVQIADWVRSLVEGPLKSHAERIAQIERETSEASAEARPAVSATAEVPTLGGSSSGAKSPEPPRRRDRLLAVTAAVGVAAILGFVMLRGVRAPIPPPATAAAVIPLAEVRDASPPAPPTPAPEPPVSASASAPVLRPRRPPAAPTGKKCAPYTIDEQGHKVFNASCL